ncbi:centromere protein N isoform X2 [Mus pahari]|uniref:centromere protein N isoform X2 n=1 Tax=Mus pahari TaxID=10093 RepID=UPI001114776A|nr:centromere protein N isoform X2 [Mus pahari]
MKENVVEFLRRTILKIPLCEMKTILEAWDFLSEDRLQTINLKQRKEFLAQEVILLCEDKCASLDDVALLDIVYTQFHREQKLWSVFQMSNQAGENVDLFDMEQFQSSFKRILQRALKNVTVSFRVYEKNSVWIRVAWGTQHLEPNQYKPTFVVYYPQTPYAFISSCYLKNTVPLLHQALKVASKHHEIVQLELRSRHLDSLKAIVFREYNQTFENYNSTIPLAEGSLGLEMSLDSRITHENTEEKVRIHQVTQETFGAYPQPQLEFAQYKE